MDSQTVDPSELTTDSKPVNKPVAETVPPDNSPTGDAKPVTAAEFVLDSDKPPETVPGESSVKRGHVGQHPKTCRCGRCKWSRPPGVKYTRPTAKAATPSTDQSAEPFPDAPTFDDVLPGIDTAAQDYKLMATMTFDMGTNSLAMILGPEWQAQNPQERDIVIESLKKYFEVKQVKDIPPGWMLTFVLLTYSVPRLRQPSTSGKLKLGWQWVKNKFGGLFRFHRQPLIIQPTTQTHEKTS